MQPRPTPRFLLTTLLVFIALPLFAGDSVSTEAAAEITPVARDELAAERTLYTKTFANADGSTTFQLAAEPVHFRRPGSAEWLDVDTTLEPAAGWVVEAANVPVHLPQVLGAGEPIAAGPDFGIRWTPGPLRARLWSGEDVELARPRASEGRQVEGRRDAVLYADLYPGVDLRVEVRAGAVLLTTLMKSFPFDVDRREIEAFVLDAEVKLERRLLQAMEEHLATAGEESASPVHFGTFEDEYVVTLTDGPGRPLTPGDPGSDPAGPIARFLRTRHVEHVFRHPIPPDPGWLPEGASTTTAALTAKLTFAGRTVVHTFHPLRQPDPRADVVTVRDHICSDGLVLKAWGGTAGFPAGVLLRAADGRRTGPTVDESGTGPDGLPRRRPTAALCHTIRDVGYDFALTVASFGGLRDLRDKLLPPPVSRNCAPATGAERAKPVVNLQLGYKLTANDPTPREQLYHVFARRVPPQVLSATKPLSDRMSWGESEVEAILQAPEYAFNLDLFTRSNGKLLLVSKPADCYSDDPRRLPKLNCNRIFGGAWGRYTSDRGGFTFGALDRQEALDDLRAALCADADYFHVALSGGPHLGAEPVYAELADLRLEVTTRDEVVPAAEIDVSDPLGPDGRPDAARKAALFPGETLRFAVDLLKLDNAAEVTLSANDLDLFNEYGLQVSWQRTPSGPQLFDRATLEKRPASPPPGFDKDKAVLTVSWSHPGKRIHWSDPARRSTAMLRIGAAFPGAQSRTQTLAIPIALRDLDGRIEVRSPSRLLKVPGTVPIVPTAGPLNLGILQGSLQGATEMRLRVSHLYVPGSTRLDPVPASYYELGGARLSAGSDEAALVFSAAQLAKDHGAGIYVLVVEPCLSSSLASGYEECREDRRERLVLEIQGDPQIDFVFRSELAPTGSDKNYRFDVHGSGLGDSTVTRVKMSGLTVTAEPTVLAGSTAKTLNVQSRLRGTAACGPHRLTVSRFSAGSSSWRVASHVVNLHRGAGDSVVFEAEVGEVEGKFFKDVSRQPLPRQTPSNGELVTLADGEVDGSVSWQFRVPAWDSGYRIYLRSRTRPDPNPGGGSGTLEKEDPNAASGWKTTRTFDWTVTDSVDYDVRMLNLNLPDDDTFELEDQKTYRLTLRHRANHKIPQIDMVVIALRRPPVDADLCFGP